MSQKHYLNNTPLFVQLPLTGYNIDSKFFDGDDDPLTYAATMSDGSALPSWLMFNAAEGKFYGTAPTAQGTYSLKVSAADADINVVRPFSLVVSAPDTGTFNDDTYSYNGGVKNIHDIGGANDILSIGATFALEGLTFTNLSVTDLKITSGSGNEIVIYGQIGTDSARYIEKLIFADGFSMDLGNYSNWIWSTGTVNGDNNNAVGIDLADTIIGAIGDDVIASYDRDDVIHGRAGNDNISGGNGNDIIYGGIGNDTLEGGAGDDTLNGGDGADFARYSGASSAVTINLSITGAQDTLGAGIDTLIGMENINGSAYNDILIGDSGANNIFGANGDDIIEGGAGNDVLTGGNGIDTLSYAGATAGVTVSLAIVTAQNTLGAGTDSASGFENLLGSAFNDTLTGDGNANTITGGAGNDTINGGLGNDVLDGGVGNDTLSGGGGNDTYYYLSGQDTIAETGTDIDRVVFVPSLSINDVRINGNILTFANSTNSITFNDISLIEAFSFNGHADMTLSQLQAYSSVGSTFVATNAAEAFVGTGTSDTVDYNSSTAAVTVSLLTNTGTNGYAQGDTYLSIENLIGSAYADSLTGDTGNNSLSGGSGNDTLEGGVGDDTLNGGDGADFARYAGASSAVTINLSIAGAQDTLGAGIDTLVNMENISGSAYNDTLIGDSAANNIFGANGDDIIEGGAGNDVLTGGNGIDTLSYAGASSAVTVSLATITSQNTLGAGTDSASGFENLLGSAFNDTLTGDGNANTITGGAGNDIISGGAGNDIYIYSSGADTITEISGGGIDKVVFDSSLSINDVTILGNILSFANYSNSITFNDITQIEAFSFNGHADMTLSQLQAYSSVGTTFVATSAAEAFVGTGTSDTVDYNISTAGVTANLLTNTGTNGYAQGDTYSSIENLIGSAYADTLTGDTANNILTGLAGNDTLEGGAGDDTLNGGDGADFARYSGASSAVTINLSITGAQNTLGAGIDTLINMENISGSAYNDILIGDSGANNIFGANGNDIIEGGAGNDVLTGGNGIDTLSYAGAASAVIVSLATTTSQNTLGAGTDSASGFENLLGSAFSDTLTGDGNANTITGGAGNDTINGGLGNDTLDGGIGNDTLTGGGGNDTYYYLSGQDIINETGTDIDRVVFAPSLLINDVWINGNVLTFINSTNSITFNDIAQIEAFSFDGHADMTLSQLQAYSSVGTTFVATSAAEAFVGTGTSDTVDYNASTAGVTANLLTNTGANGYAQGDTYASIENLIGSAYADSLTGDTGNNSLSGGVGNDSLEGGLGNDILDGGDGTDMVRYQIASTGVIVDLRLTGPQDTVGAGVDTLINIEGIYGSAYDDILIGNAVINNIYGHNGDDIIEGGAGNDVLTGGNGIDTLSYAHATAAVTVNMMYASQNTGGAGTDSISGFENLLGSAFNDLLTGDSNANTINGGAGNDLLQGGLGSDILIGGGGSDVFQFTSTTLDSTIDHVTDFSLAEGDKVRFSNVLFGYDPVTSAIEDFIAFTTSGSNTLVSIDRDGAGTTYGWQQVSQLDNVTGMNDEAALRTNGNLIIV